MITAISFGRSRTPATIERRKQTKEGLEKSENILRITQNKYGRPNSSTYIQMKLAPHKDNPKYAEVSRKLRDNAERYSEELMFQPYRAVDRCINGRKNGESLVGDCGECARAVQSEFCMQYGQPTVNIVLEATKANKNFCNHAFNLSNIEKGASPTDPKSWGKQAIITDLWSGIALKSEDAIRHFYSILGVNPFTDKIEFKAMPDSESSIQHAALDYFGMLPPKPHFNIWDF